MDRMRATSYTSSLFFSSDGYGPTTLLEQDVLLKQKERSTPQDKDVGYLRLVSICFTDLGARMTPGAF